MKQSVRVFAAASAVALAVSLSACSGDTGSGSPAASQSAQATTKASASNAGGASSAAQAPATQGGSKAAKVKMPASAGIWTLDGEPKYDDASGATFASYKSAAQPFLMVAVQPGDAKAGFEAQQPMDTQEFGTVKCAHTKTTDGKGIVCIAPWEKGTLLSISGGVTGELADYGELGQAIMAANGK